MSDIATLGLAVDSSKVDKAKDSLNSMTKAAQTAQAGVTALVDKVKEFALAYLSIDTLKSTIEKFVEETAKSESQLAQLNATLQATGGAAGISAGQLEQLAIGLSKTTTFAAGTTEAAEALLLTFSHIKSDMYPQVIKLTQDLSTALGSDLSSAALVVGKALNDPVNGLTALGRAGVQFDDSQKALIKHLIETGQTAAAQTQILNKLQAAFGGSAAAARNTLGGAIQALGNAFNDLFIISQDKVAPLQAALDGLIDKLEDPNFISAVQTFGVTIVNAMTEALPLIENFLNNMIAIHDLFSDFQSKSNIGQLGAIADVQNQITTLENNIDNNKAILAAGGSGTLWGLEDGSFQAQIDKDTAAIQPLIDKMNDLQVTMNGGVHSAAIGGDVAPSSFDFEGFLNNKTKPAKQDVIVQQDQLDALAAQAKAYAKITTTAQQKIAANQLDAQTLGMTAEATAALADKQDLLNAAASAGIKLTSDQKDALDNLAAQMASTEAETKKLTDLYDFGQSALEGFFSDMKTNLEQGENLWQSFGGAVQNVLGKIEDKALGMAADGIWDNLFGALKGILTGGISSGLGVSTPGMSSLGGDLIGPSSANGNIFMNGISGYSNSIVSHPTLFPFANGIGLMGERGPEAVMPLVRGSDGRLGVDANNNNGSANHDDQQESVTTINVHFHGVTDMPSFQKSKAQIMTQLARAAGGARRYS